MDLQKIYSKVFGWMFIGLILTFGTGFVISQDTNLTYNLVTSGAYWIMAIAEIGIAIFFSMRIKKMSKVTAMICFAIYAVLTGATFSTIFLAYSLGSIIMCFGVAAILFAIMALIGHFTKLDLSKFGAVLFMILLGSIIMTVVNVFIGSTTINTFLNVLILAVFICYVAYDMKKISGMVDYAGVDNGSIYMAFQLYLDFINMFLRLLQLFGKRDD